MGMGALGAISGGASGLSQAILMDMEESKSARLDTLRAENNRETNTQNNQQRHDFSMTEQAQRVKDTEAAGVSAQTRLQENTEHEYGLKNDSLTPTQKNAQSAIEAGVDAKKVWSSSTTTGGKDSRPSEQKLIEFYKNMGKGNAEAIALAKQGKGKSREQMVLDYVNNMGYTNQKPEDKLKEAQYFVDKVMGGTPAGAADDSTEGDSEEFDESKLQLIRSANPEWDLGKAKQYYKYLGL